MRAWFLHRPKIASVSAWTLALGASITFNTILWVYGVPYLLFWWIVGCFPGAYGLEWFFRFMERQKASEKIKTFYQHLQAQEWPEYGCLLLAKHHPPSFWHIGYGQRLYAFSTFYPWTGHSSSFHQEMVKSVLYQNLCFKTLQKTFETYTKSQIHYLMIFKPPHQDLLCMVLPPYLFPGKKPFMPFVFREHFSTSHQPFLSAQQVRNFLLQTYPVKTAP